MLHLLEMAKKTDNVDNGAAIGRWENEGGALKTMTERFVFHGEYWLYLFGGISVVVVGILIHAG